ncbi:DNA repair protein RecO [Candidatus Protochlamydia phocaeensis]|uniref:DNA repair protein RecO n=1 Tax=Candidatus Protochlamydia phocaeensis TaxID=1414722 RepID=UPI000838A917|nr:DNA repair protein RecO [Candidatus Protochlamydia phocaeensis]
MSESFQRTEGIILRTIPFRDYDQILVLFTQDAGLIKLLYKGSRSKKRGVQGICMPLTRVEVIFKEKKGEIFSCQEISLLDSYRPLRQQLSSLEAGCELLQVLYATQWVGKPSPQLYALLKYYLEKIPAIPYPAILTTSFRLKLLKHEGLLTFPLRCSHCQQPLVSQAYSYQSDLFCLQHHVPGSLYLQQKELDVLYKLMDCKTFQDLTQVLLPADFKAKMEIFFKERMQK